MTVIISHDRVRRRRFIRDANRLGTEAMKALRDLEMVAWEAQQEDIYLPKAQVDVMEATCVRQSPTW